MAFLGQLVSTGPMNYARKTLEDLGNKRDVQSLPRPAKTAQKTLMKPEKMKRS